jgi:succinyl-CoA synthetase beta subunit
MKIHEYQGKEIFRRFGMPVPRGIAVFSVEEAVDAALDVGGPVWVVKAQIHAGGRGKGGGVKLARSIEEVRARASEILGMQLVTHQTGPAGQKVRRLLIEEGADIKKEFYVGMVVDRATQQVTLIASSEGGVNIEEVAANTPEKIHKVHIEQSLGLSDRDADDISIKIGIPSASVPAARAILSTLQSVLGNRRVIGGNQSSDPDRQRPADRARLEDELRFECAVPAPGHRGIARPGRGRSGRNRSIQV